MSDTRKIIDYTFDENAVGVRDALYAAIHDRVTAHIEDKKQEIARGLIAQHDEEVDMDPEDDDNEPEDGELEEEEDLEEAVGEMHPDASKVLKHIKPEHHSTYKPYLKKGTYKGTYSDRAAVLGAAEKAGHAVSESSPFDVLDKTKKYKSQIPDSPGKKAGFSHKRVSTGDIYSRDAKDEPATPSKKK
jgi:hypothetical protein